MRVKKQTSFSCPKCGGREFTSRDLVEMERTNNLNLATRTGTEKYSQIVNATTVEAWSCRGCAYKLNDEEDEVLEVEGDGCAWDTNAI
jgi:predicted nucleic-acid-binding Zn-ribbon protein